MTAAALDVKLNLKVIDMAKKDHLTPEFLKLNPQHTVPTLVDDGFAIWESRAICIYLIDKFAKNDSLYPKDPKTRAVINQRIFFDLSTLYKNFGEYYFASFYGKTKDPETLKKVHESVEHLNTFLDSSKFVAGTPVLSVADLIIFASISTFEAANFDFTPYPNVAKWFAIMKETAPGRELNQEGADQLKAFL